MCVRCRAVSVWVPAFFVIHILLVASVLFSLFAEYIKNILYPSPFYFCLSLLHRPHFGLFSVPPSFYCQLRRGCFCLFLHELEHSRQVIRVPL